MVAGSIAAPAYAWHPKGLISKTVQNVTAGTAVSDANTATAAMSAKPGDILKYTITVSNTAAAADKHYNDLAFTVMTDQLPAGVELVSSPATRNITENMGTILPGKNVSKTYTVKVTSTTNNAVIENKACFTADSVVKDNPQKGCDTADVKVTVPPVVTPPVTPVTPTTPVTPETPVTPQTPVVTPEQPTVLPNAGTGSNIALFALGATVLGFAASTLRNKRRVIA
ncbi:MAG: hypothetical protein JWR77_2695 [Rhizorhabdus sp.]|nr:hypothetical protein [Rhizorhabdus sp.]